MNSSRLHLAAEAFKLEGILVASPPGCVRILVDSAALDFDREDLLALEPLDRPNGLAPDCAKLVRAELRRGARLIRAGSAAAYESLIWKRAALFAVEARSADPPFSTSRAYQELERVYFAEIGIELPPHEEQP